MLYEALDSFMEALYRFVDLLGEECIHVASTHADMAVTYFHLDELKSALTH